MLTITDTASKLGVTESALRIWKEEGTLKPVKVATDGTWYYSDDQIDAFENPDADKITLVWSPHHLDKVEGYIKASGLKYQLLDNFIHLFKLIETGKYSRLAVYSRKDLSEDKTPPVNSASKLMLVICEDNNVPVVRLCKLLSEKS